MKKNASTGLCLIVALTASLAGPARASDKATDQQTPIRLYASARFGPIGAIKLNALSGDAVAINGRIAQGDELIWGGELIKALSDRKARIALDSIGRMILARGAMVRVTTAHAALDDDGYEVLVASIVSGSVEVSLDPRAGAYVEAGTSAFTASRGARFNVSVDEGRAQLATVAGTVRIQDQAVPQDVNIRIVDELGRPVASGAQFSVRARSTRQVQVQVTDKNDKPLPDLPVLFSLGDPCLGSLGLGAVAGMSLTQKTDKRGIAAVPLVAGAARCAASILAKVEGTNASVSIQTNVTPKQNFFNTRNNLLMAAAVGIGVGVYVTTSGNGGETLTPVPPPTIRP